MRKRPNIHYATFHGTGRGFVRVPVPIVEADRGASFRRLKEHVAEGAEGESCTCANALGALAELGGDAWEFTDTKAYKYFKNRKGQLYKGIVYDHNQGQFQSKYDRRGKASLLRSPDCEGLVLLHAPKPRKKLEQRRRQSSEDGSAVKKREKRARGSLARLERRGIVV